MRATPTIRKWKSLMVYESRVRLLGLPLVHVVTGHMEDGRYRRGIARGWVAIGDIAFGGFLAVGGIAVGGISFGGLAVGGLALAGVSVGVFALGGLAVGLMAAGGAAFGWVAAIGGLAVAREVALGGLTAGAHANDAAAREFFQQPVPRLVVKLLEQARWLWLLLLIPVIIGLRSSQEDAPASRDRAT